MSGTTSAPPPDTTPPAQVIGLTVTTASSTQLNLIWTQNAEPDLNHYNVYQGSTPGFSVIPGTTPPTASPNANAFSNTGLSPSTIYYYRVAAVDNAGNIGPLSVERSGTTSAPPDTTPPAQVTGLSITVVSSNQLNLTWNINTEPDLARYYVYRGPTSGFSVTPGTTVPVGQPTTNSLSDTTLASSTTYYYKVAAVDTSGNIGPLSTEVSGTTSAPPPDTTPPAQVIGLTVTTASSTQLNLIWTQNAEPDLNHYNVYQGSTPGFSVIPGTTPPTASPNANAFSNTGLSPSTIYYYRVAAVDNAGNIGPLSVERSGTTSAPPDTTPPAQVTGLSITVVSSISEFDLEY